MLVFRVANHKMLARIANRKDPDQTASESDLGLHCLSRPFWQATKVRNFRTLLWSSHLINLSACSIILHPFCRMPGKNNQTFSKT